MLHKALYAFFYIFNRDRIPKLPRGMLASDYDNIPDDARRVMARYGARDPKGVQAALKKYGVKTVSELCAILQHQEAQRNVMHRVNLGIERLVGGVKEDHYRDEIIRATRPKKEKQKEIEARIKRARLSFKEKQE